MPSRLRRQQMLPPDDDSPVSRREDERRHYDDMNAHDEETGFKGKKTRNHPAHIFNVSLERFCLKSFTTLRGSSLTVVAPRERGRIVVPSFLLLMFVYIIISRMIPQHLSLRHESDWALENTPLKIKLFDFTNANDLGGWHYPASQSFHSTRPINISKSPDYNGLTIVSLRNATIFRRMVASGDYEASERYRRGIVQPDKKEKHTDIYFQHDEEVLSLECRRQNWQGLYFPNCNDFHDIDLGRQAESLQQLEYYDSYRISNGAFRDAWVLQKPSRDNNTESVILKNLRIDLKFTIEDMKGIQRDAIVMERLTSSPRIIDVYGYCATSTIVEAMKYEVEEYVVPGSGMAKQMYLDKFEGLHPMNVYTIEQKLYMALEMAESIADLHGYPEGVVVHDDIQLCQWLEHSDGRIKLGDFNRAEMMEWNDTDNSYCKYENGEVNGNVSTIYIFVSFVASDTLCCTHSSNTVSCSRGNAQ